jgi:virginiamycin B lyase
MTLGPELPRGIRRWTGITTAGVITTWALPRSAGTIDTFTFGAGFLWSVDYHALNDSFVGRWTLTGTLVKEFPVPETAYAIAWGSDGALWFSDANVSGMELSNSFIGRMTVQGVVTQYSLPDENALAGDFVTGPDGDIWFLGDKPGTFDGAVLAMTTGGTTTADYPVDGTPGIADGSPTVIATGADGMIWFGDGNAIARLNPSIPPTP